MTIAPAKYPTNISTTRIRQSYKKKKQVQKSSEVVKKQSKKAQKCSELVKKQSKKAQKIRSAKCTVIIKSKKTSQITQGRVRKEDGQVICNAMRRHGNKND